MKTLLLFFLLGASTMVRSEVPPAPAALPQGSLYALDATWTNQAGKKVVWKESTGSIRVVAVGYATCKGLCPRIIADMQRIEKELTAGELARCRFTFVTLDPKNDGVPELKALGERHKLDDARWDLLTGEEDALLDLAVALGIRYDRLPNGIDFVHSYQIAVIGPDGSLRHKWTESGQGAQPSIEAIRKAMTK